MEKEEVNSLLFVLCREIDIKKPKQVYDNVISKMERGSRTSVERLMLFEFGRFHKQQMLKNIEINKKLRKELKTANNKIAELKKKPKIILKRPKQLKS
ncbi:MAG: hypothetical protein HRU18_01810 [Pseudoalteromonas sp.]|uniref:hypothetical protein n=1 Tax=Pseudoalteromonas sp. TaxID=53249 RepID=UPI001E0845F4|nr:hypothetical protein [Pseudoalteromonas sp.]NRA76918.1 hypothetical protein [Pseudoalteromonas sp.]